MKVRQNEIVSQITRINEILYGNHIQEQSYGLPIIPLHTNQELDKIGDWVETWDKKDWLTFIEVSTGILSMIPTPASPVLMSISTIAGFANAKVHWDEGYKYEAGLMFTFSLLGVGTLYKLLKNSKVFNKIGKEGIISLLKKVTSGSASKNEKKIVKELVKEITPVADDLAKETTKEIFKKFIAELPKKSLKFLVRLLLTMFRLGKFGVKEGIVILGTFFTYDKLYKALNYKNEKALSEREKNGLVKIYNFIWDNEEEVQKVLIEETKKYMAPMIKNPDDFLSIKVDTTEVVFK